MLGHLLPLCRVCYNSVNQLPSMWKWCSNCYSHDNLPPLILKLFALQNCTNIFEYLVNTPCTLYCFQYPPFFIVINERRCLGIIDIKPFLDCRLFVIIPLKKLTAAFITYPILL